MSFVITNGVGNSNKARVDKRNRLHTKAVTVSAYEQAIIDGDSYTIATGIVTLTTDTISYIVYFTNNEERNLVLEIQTLQLGNSINGVGSFHAPATVNPSGGTIITNGADGFAFNRNLSSPNTLDSTVKIGGEGFTIEGGGTLTDLFPNSGRDRTVQKLRIPKGSSIAFGLIPPTGNTSVEIAFSIDLYLDEAGVNK